MNDEPFSEELKRELWGEGEWLTEPDRVHWVYKGINCLISRSESGALCGYIEVPANHPWYQLNVFENYEEMGVDVWGGLTFGEGNDNGMWVIGFDCSHFNDFVPALEKFMVRSELRIPLDVQKRLKTSGLFNRLYKNIAFVTKEVESLADQMLAIKK